MNNIDGSIHTVEALYPTLLLAIAAFFLGACPFSLWIGQWALGKNIRNYGDGNHRGSQCLPSCAVWDDNSRLCFFLGPFLLALERVNGGGYPHRFATIIIFQVTLIIAMRWLVDQRFKEPTVSAFLHPFGFSFLFLSSINAGVRGVIGKGIC